MSGYVATDVFGRRTVSPTIRKRLSATSSEHSTSILRGGLPPGLLQTFREHDLNFYWANFWNAFEATL
ncbi:MAG: hypothetical protein ACLSE4_09980, partial [Clostridium sp.]